jgi:hypothetical protein
MRRNLITSLLEARRSGLRGEVGVSRPLVPMAGSLCPPPGGLAIRAAETARDPARAFLEQPAHTKERSQEPKNLASKLSSSQGRSTETLSLICSHLRYRAWGFGVSSIRCALVALWAGAWSSCGAELDRLIPAASPTGERRRSLLPTCFARAASQAIAGAALRQGGPPFAFKARWCV